MNITCKACNCEKPETDFYNSKGVVGVKYWCKKCFNKYCTAKNIEKKKMFVKLCGNKCKTCNIKHNGKNTPIYDFHHVDASSKDADWSRMRKWSIERIRGEISKCILLCSNCHRMHHNRQSYAKK